MIIINQGTINEISGTKVKVFFSQDEEKENMTIWYTYKA